jgi:hypothetical protein
LFPHVPLVVAFLLPTSIRTLNSLPKAYYKPQNQVTKLVTLRMNRCSRRATSECFLSLTGSS